MSQPLFVYHFSEDPEITTFAPHRPVGRETEEARVWAIDAEHAPLYWFPRDCPRVTFWAVPGSPFEAVRAFLGATTARRVHAIESDWLERVRATQLYVYRFDAAGFEPWPEADGHWVSRTAQTPLAVEPIGDLLSLHAEAGIELRITPSLWPLHDAIPGSGLRFSIVRMRNGAPRAAR